MAGRGKLIAVIGDEDTVTGFLLGGIGELNKNRHPNFLVVEKDTTVNEIEDTFRDRKRVGERETSMKEKHPLHSPTGEQACNPSMCSTGNMCDRPLGAWNNTQSTEPHHLLQFLNRDDIGIILINQYIAEMVRHALDAHQRSIPAVLEIPSKEHPYDAAKDSILRRAKGMFTAEDLR